VVLGICTRTRVQLCNFRVLILVGLFVLEVAVLVCLLVLRVAVLVLVVVLEGTVFNKFALCCFFNQIAEILPLLSVSRVCFF